MQCTVDGDYSVPASTSAGANFVVGADPAGPAQTNAIPRSEPMSGKPRPIIAITDPAFWQAASDIGGDGVLVLILPLEQLVGGS